MIAPDDDEFWDEHDPYGDRYSKPVPRWAYWLALFVIAGAVYATAHA